MSLHQVQKCLFDYLRARHAPPDQKPDISVEGYDHTDEERKAVTTLDVGTLYAMGTHPVIINGLCRSMGYRRADYRPLLAGSAVPQPRRTRWQKWVRAWVAVAGAMRGRPMTVLSYEPIYEWINGMGVVTFAVA